MRLAHFPGVRLLSFCSLMGLFAEFGHDQALAVSSPAETSSSDAYVPGRLWETRVRPILEQHCVRCHGHLKQKSGLDLRDPASIFKGGRRGPAIVPGEPGKSRLVRFVLPDGDPHMPPGKTQLSQSEIAILSEWIATDPFKPVESLPITARKTSVDQDPQRSAERPWMLPAKINPTLAIDLLIEHGWRQRNVQPSKRCDDRVFVRRIYLDLTGRIPSRRETEAFLAETRSDKRRALIDSLLASDEYPRHMREVFDVVLMGRRGPGAQRARKKHGWHDYLERAFRANRPWDAIVRDVVLARSEQPEIRPAAWFFYERKNDHKAIVESLAPASLGVQIQCAQCHDHPLAPEIKQAHYWGLVAFLNRSKNVETSAGPAVAESAVGGFVKFADLEGESHDALLRFLNDRVVPEQPPAEGQEESDQPQLYRVAPPVDGETAKAPSNPWFSRREQLAEVMRQDSRRLARAFVNRTWALLMGRGLVHPVDKMDSSHPPSHPELLTWLAADFEGHGYDIKRLIRSITLSRAYQLASTPAEASPPAPAAFACGLEKPLSAEALYRSMLVATGNADDAGQWITGIDRQALHRAFVETFPDLFAETYSPTLKQSLFLSNAPMMQVLLKPRQGNTTAILTGMVDLDRRVDEAFRTILGRPPVADELEAAVHYFHQREDRPEAAVRQMVWALLTGAEFMLNH